MTALSSRITALTVAVLVNGLLMTGAMYLFALQSNAHASPVAFAKAIITHPWLT